MVRPGQIQNKPTPGLSIRWWAPDPYSVKRNSIWVCYFTFPWWPRNSCLEFWLVGERNSFLWIPRTRNFINCTLSPDQRNPLGTGQGHILFLADVWPSSPNKEYLCTCLKTCFLSGQCPVFLNSGAWFGTSLWVHRILYPWILSKGIHPRNFCSLPGP